MKAVFNIDTNLLIITGNEIKTHVKVIEKMGGWDTLSDLGNNPIYDYQLDFDDSMDKISDFTYANPKNYNLQYVTLKETGIKECPYEQGNDWNSIELTLISTEPTLQIHGCKSELVFNPSTARFIVKDNEGKELCNCMSLTMASDIYITNHGASFFAIDTNGIKKVLK
jgi:hypothetical protein